jgi:hypothetical protein
MSYLQAVPRFSDVPPAARAVTVVSPEKRDVVYVEQQASIELITEALKAWGIRVRAERDQQQGEAKPATTQIDANWQTTRPEAKAPTRLDNELSPLWFPIERPAASAEPVAAWAWFGRAA